MTFLAADDGTAADTAVNQKLRSDVPECASSCTQSRRSPPLAAFASALLAVEVRIWRPHNHTLDLVLEHPLRTPWSSLHHLLLPLATPAHPGKKILTGDLKACKTCGRWRGLHLEHFVDIGSAEDLVDIGELLGLIRREVGRKDAIPSAPASEQLASRTR